MGGWAWVDMRAGEKHYGFQPQLAVFNRLHRTHLITSVTWQNAVLENPAKLAALLRAAELQVQGAHYRSKGYSGLCWQTVRSPNHGLDLHFALCLTVQWQHKMKRRHINTHMVTYLFVQGRSGRCLVEA